MILEKLLLDFFRVRAPLSRGQGLVIAFSGGPDSCALLAVMKDLSMEQGFELYAAHLDHGLDKGSAERAWRAAEIASSLDTPFIAERVSVCEELLSGEATEAGARRLRYAFLEKTRQSLGARYIATAHHRDDQAETALLRLTFGTGLDGMAGILSIHGTVVRPLLSATRDQLTQEVSRRKLAPVIDPSNSDVRYQRNRIRHQILPLLVSKDPELPQRLAAVASAAARARTKIDDRLARLLDFRQEPRGEASVCFHRFRTLPAEVYPSALAALQRGTDAAYPIPRNARRELCRQMRSGHRVQLDCGGGWRLAEDRERLWLSAPEPPMPFFSYTFKVPGALEIPEIGACLRLSPGQEGVIGPNREGDPDPFELAHRACLQLPLQLGQEVTVRNRRPGDRLMRPGPGSGRRLKEILIDRKVPQRNRDRLPLLCIGGSIVWIPGIATGTCTGATCPVTAWNAEITES